MKDEKKSILFEALQLSGDGIRILSWWLITNSQVHRIFNELIHTHSMKIYIQDKVKKAYKNQETM